MPQAEGAATKKHIHFWKIGRPADDVRITPESGHPTLVS
jgi:hypothetical protein